MRLKTQLDDITCYLTKDGSEIRELMHPEVNGNRNQSLAQARVPSRVVTKLHRHKKSEELYHITAGRGRMTLEHDSFDVTIGDTICIPPGTAHQIANAGPEDLVFLCCCAPAYSHEDTELL